MEYVGDIQNITLFYKKIEFIYFLMGWMIDLTRFRVMYSKYNHFLLLNKCMLMYEGKI